MKAGQVCRLIKYLMCSLAEAGNLVPVKESSKSKERVTRAESLSLLMSFPAVTVDCWRIERLWAFVKDAQLFVDLKIYNHMFGSIIFSWVCRHILY